MTDATPPSPEGPTQAPHDLNGELSLRALRGETWLSMNELRGLTGGTHVLSGPLPTPAGATGPEADAEQLALHVFSLAAHPGWRDEDPLRRAGVEAQLQAAHEGLRAAHEGVCELNQREEAYADLTLSPGERRVARAHWPLTTELLLIEQRLTRALSVSGPGEAEADTVIRELRARLATQLGQQPDYGTVSPAEYLITGLWPDQAPLRRLMDALTMAPNADHWPGHTPEEARWRRAAQRTCGLTSTWRLLGLTARVSGETGLTHEMHGGELNLHHPGWSARAWATLDFLRAGSGVDAGDLSSDPEALMRVPTLPSEPGSGAPELAPVCAAFVLSHLRPADLQAIWAQATAFSPGLRPTGEQRLILIQLCAGLLAARPDTHLSRLAAQLARPDPRLADPDPQDDFPPDEDLPW